MKQLVHRQRLLHSEDKASCAPWCTCRYVPIHTLNALPRQTDRQTDVPHTHISPPTHTRTRTHAHTHTHLEWAYVIKDERLKGSAIACHVEQWGGVGAGGGGDREEF
jgi:hypothetical protein